MHDQHPASDPAMREAVAAFARGDYATYCAWLTTQDRKHGLRAAGVRDEFRTNITFTADAKQEDHTMDHKTTPYEEFKASTTMPAADAQAATETPEAAPLKTAEDHGTNNPYAREIDTLKTASAVPEAERNFRLARLEALEADYDRLQAAIEPAPRTLSAQDVATYDAPDIYGPSLRALRGAPQKPEDFAETFKTMRTAQLHAEQAEIDAHIKATPLRTLSDDESAALTPGNPYLADIEKLTRREAKRKADVMAGRRWS